MTRTPLSTSVREGYRRVVELDGYVSENVDETIKNLVYLRASSSTAAPTASTATRPIC